MTVFLVYDHRGNCLNSFIDTSSIIDADETVIEKEKAQKFSTTRGHF